MNANPILFCWSATQAAVRYEPLEDSLRINNRAFTENRQVDYVPIAAFNTMKEAEIFFEQHRAEFERRYDARRKDKGCE